MPRTEAKRSRWLLVAIPPDGRQPFPLLSPATDRPLVLEYGRAFAERVAQRNTKRLAWTGFRFVAKAA